MANPHEIPGALEELQDSIYRERVLRARRMSPTERLDSVFDLSNSQAKRFLEGVRIQTGLTNPEEIDIEARRRMQRLEKARDQEYYRCTPPADNGH